MKILVIGGLGTVGKPLVEELKNRNHEVWIADKNHSSIDQYIRCDISEYRQVERLFEQNFDFVYHLAAEFGRINGETFYENLWKTNAIGTKNILRMQEKKKFKMIFTSSSEIYGNSKMIMHEDVPMQHTIRQLNDYAISKWVNELQIMNSMDVFDTKTVRLRLFNIYGPGEYYSKYRSVICQFIYKALHSLPYTIYLKHHRSSLYIDDAVRTMANVVDNFKSGEVYNISGEEYHDIKTVSDTILNLLGKQDDAVTYMDIDRHNTLDKRASNDKAKKDLEHEITVDLKEGIKRTIDWQKEVYKIGD